MPLKLKFTPGALVEFGAFVFWWHYKNDVFLMIYLNKMKEFEQIEFRINRKIKK
jgi:hypothetical protein